MGQKLSTLPDLKPTPIINVKGNKGQTFTGKYLGSKVVNTFFGEKNVYEFSVIEGDMPVMVKDGDEYKETDVKAGDKAAIFAPTRLNNALKQAAKDSIIKITYLGLGKAVKGKPPHNYEVEVL